MFVGASVSEREKATFKAVHYTTTDFCGSGASVVASEMLGYGQKVAHDDGKSLDARSNASSIPQFPGEHPLSHEAALYKDQLEARLADRGLLAVAQGHPPPATLTIVDTDLSALPALPVAHRDHQRRLETRTRITAQNTANAESRYNLTMRA